MPILRIAPLDPDHIPPPPRRPGGTPPPVPKKSRGLRITIVGLGPLQEACLVGTLALALSWGSAELLFLLASRSPAETAPAILAAVTQP